MLLTSYHNIDHSDFLPRVLYRNQTSNIYVFQAPGFKVDLNINETSR